MLTFEWDETKHRRNRAKHSINFEQAKAVFYDIYALEILDGRENYGEERWLTVGTAQGQMLAVVNIQRGELYRIISARTATRKETDAYYKNRAGT